MFDVENLRKTGVKKIWYPRVTYLQPLLIQDILVLKLLTHKYSCICTNNCHGDTKYYETITVSQVIQTSDIDISFKSPCPDFLPFMQWLFLHNNKFENYA